MSTITVTRQGAWCDVCGAALGQEEIDFECCGCCGGECLGDEDDDFDVDDFSGPSEEGR